MQPRPPRLIELQQDTLADDFCRFALRNGQGWMTDREQSFAKQPFGAGRGCRLGAVAHSQIDALGLQVENLVAGGNPDIDRPVLLL